MEKNIGIPDTSEGRKAVTVGTFDGVHRGHRKVVEFLKEEGSRLGLQPLVITFEPHPLAVVAPERAPKLLELPEERVRRLEATGVEVEVMKFDESLRRTTVREWLTLLRDRFNADLLVVGYDNTFGSDGMKMSAADYRRLAEEAGIRLEVAPIEGGICSSAIRKSLIEGDVTSASQMLGRPYSIAGRIGHGRGDGHKLGFPTANMQIPDILMLPAPGVYAADAILSDGERKRAVVNIGVAPTIEPGLPLTVEVHIADFDKDIYGDTLRIEFLRRLRNEKRFQSLDSLKSQIAADIREAEICNKI